MLSSQVGFDARVFFRFLRRLPIFYRDWFVFKKGYSGRINLMPCLHDRYEEGGAIKNEYFWQDLIVAQLIYNANPSLHVDIGSRVDGFVAHLATFRNLEVFDVRPITAQIPGVEFRQVDLMSEINLPVSKTENGYCDSLSCLHALEHFGWGRYGDKIDPLGYVLGIANMSALLKPGGVFYLSVPIGIARVEFNSHRVFDPRHIIKLASSHELVFRELNIISQEGKVHFLKNDMAELDDLAEKNYNLGIFVFTKV